MSAIRPPSTPAASLRYEAEWHSAVRVHQHGAAIKKGRRRSLHGTLAGRPDHQDPCLGRCRRASDPSPAHNQAGQPPTGRHSSRREGLRHRSHPCRDGGARYACQCAAKRPSPSAPSPSGHDFTARGTPSSASSTASSRYAVWPRVTIAVRTISSQHSSSSQLAYASRRYEPAAPGTGLPAARLAR